MQGDFHPGKPNPLISIAQISKAKAPTRGSSCRRGPLMSPTSKGSPGHAPSVTTSCSSANTSSPKAPIPLICVYVYVCMCMCVCVSECAIQPSIYDISPSVLHSARSDENLGKPPEEDLPHEALRPDEGEERYHEENGGLLKHKLAHAVGNMVMDVGMYAEFNLYRLNTGSGWPPGPDRHQALRPQGL